MSDILTRLLLNTGDYDSKLGRAKRSSDDFAANIGGKVAGAVGKFAAGLGIAMGASEAFNKVIESSQTAGDKYAETMEGLKRGVNEFFTALGTGDFSTFNTGLDTMISKAREAYRALDQLGNARMSFDIAQALSQRDIQEGQLAAKNKFAPIEVSLEGFDKWRQGIESMTNYTDQLTDDTQNYIRTAVESVAGIKGFTANMDNIMKGLLLDIQKSENRGRLKDEYAAQYNAFEDAISEAKRERNAGVIGRKPWERERMEAERKYNQRVQELAAQYNEAITINALLVKYGDDMLREIGGNVKSLIGLDASISSLKREFNETAYEFNNRNKNIKGFNPVEAYEGYTVYSGNSKPTGINSKPSRNIVEAISGSLAAIDNEIKKAQAEYSNVASDAAREAAYKTIKELQDKKFEIEFNIKYKDPGYKGTSTSFAKNADTMPERIEPIRIEKAAIKDNNDFVESLNAVANVMGALNGVTADSAAGWLSWAGSVMTASAQAVEAISKVVAAKTAEAAASAGASAASTPVVGWLMIGGAIAAALAAFAAIPKFAEGGIIGGSSFIGDRLLARVNSGEMILNQRQQGRLLSLTSGTNVVVHGESRVSGKNIYIALRNYMTSTGSKL